MRRFIPLLLGAAMLTGLWSSASFAQVQVDVPVDVPVGVDAPIRVDAQIAPRAVAPAVVNDQWRYKQHNGTWWYWMPENYWMTYRDGAWQRYGVQADVSATVPAPAVVTPAPVVTTPAPVITRPSTVVTPPLRFTPLRPRVGAVVRPRFRY